MGMTTQKRPSGVRVMPGFRSSESPRVPPIPRASARYFGLNEITGGVPWTSTGTVMRAMVVPPPSACVRVRWPGLSMLSRTLSARPFWERSHLQTASCRSTGFLREELLSRLAVELVQLAAV
jgi:hypothetical protein